MIGEFCRHIKYHIHFDLSDKKLFLDLFLEADLGFLKSHK